MGLYVVDVEVLWWTQASFILGRLASVTAELKLEAAALLVFISPTLSYSTLCRMWWGGTWQATTTNLFFLLRINSKFERIPGPPPQ